ncbi:MAG: hypothetical protein RBS53_09250 [Bacteroidales bacterium]|nr:hypothetical protein [Bacteroidales bacterium]NLM92692.1 DUF4878 domain-containing protein [Bacteroidales bacterium]
MKKLMLLLALGCFVAVGFSSCKSAKTGTPAEVVEAFLKHMSAGDIEKAKELCTPETAEILTQWENEGFNLFEDATFEDIQCEMISDTEAECSYYHDGDRAGLDVVKIDDEWKVLMEK